MTVGGHAKHGSGSSISVVWFCSPGIFRPQHQRSGTLYICTRWFARYLVLLYTFLYEGEKHRISHWVHIEKSQAGIRLSYNIFLLINISWKKTEAISHGIILYTAWHWPRFKVPGATLCISPCSCYIDCMVRSLCYIIGCHILYYGVISQHEYIIC